MNRTARSSSTSNKQSEVAPAQHELAPIFQTTNIAADHNQLTMEMMRKVAIRHDLVCLLHEKPFAGVNGSGKHNNWSMSTDDGQNLLDPGHTPHENVQFLLFLSAVIKAVDEYGDLLRVSAANPGNDHRLGANEAPPAIISVYLGDQLGHILDQIDAGDAKESKRGGILDSGTPMLSTLPKDSSDRNRTSPFAFTGNKFEFRMVPASISISAPNFTLNTIVAEALSGIGDRLEKATDRRAEVKTIIQEIVRKHKRVVFNGNNYAKEWVAEAAKRGLPNISSTVEAFKSIVAEKNVALYEKHKVFTRTELEARYEISLENYSKTIRIEALTMVDMARRMIQPSVIRYATFLAESVQTVKAAGADVSVQEGLLKSVSSLGVQFNEKLGALEKAIEKADATHGSSQAHAEAYRDVVFTAMGALREVGDKLETIVDESFWPMPTYGDLLFRV
jgi:glutamine synthetase